MRKLLLLIIWISTGSAFAQGSRQARIDSVFSALYATGKFSGNVLIAENGKAIYERSFGLADITTGRLTHSGCLFLLGSVSKQFTAFAIVLLARQGKLSLNDSLRHFFPSLPYSHITVRQLLNHTSGVPDYIALMDRYWDKTRFASNKDMMDMFLRYQPPERFPPGAKYEYSNTGYALLASVIEKVSGLSYADFMEQQVFRPLQLKHTIVYTRRSHPRQVNDYAFGYVFDNSLQQYVLPDSSNQFKNMLWEDGIVGEDGVNATVGDLLRWDQMLYENSLLDSAALESIFNAGTVAEGTTDYGFGWHIKQSEGYGKITFHSGGWPGYMAYIERHMSNSKTIIILRNKYSPELKMPLEAIRYILYHP